MKHDEKLLPLGRVLGAHGVKGVLKYQLNNLNSKSLREGIEIGLKRPRKPLVWKTVSAIHSGDRLSLVGLDNREDAQAFNGAELWIHRQDLPQQDHHEIYLVDMIGFHAVDAEGKKLGTISGFSDNGAQTLVEIEHNNQKVLLPFVEPILKTIQESEHIVVFDPPMGFF